MLTWDSVFFWLAVMILLLLANGFFVAVEFALVAVRRSRVQEMVESGQSGARVVQSLQSDMDNSIAGAQLGITIASLALGWVAENSIHGAIELLFGNIEGFTLPPGVGIVVAFIILTMLHVILGEQVPKSWALRVPEKMVLFLALPFRIFCAALKPFIWVMNWLANKILRLFGIPKAASEGHAIGSAEEFAIVFEQSAKAGALSAEEIELLTGSLDLKKLTARQMMVPRSEIVWLDTEKPFEESLKTVLESRHYRFPVAQGDLDKLVGIVDARQLLVPRLDGRTVNLQDVAQKVPVAPEGKSGLSILKSFRETQTDMMIVGDGYGAVRGLVTLHDVLSEVAGELPGEGEDSVSHVTECETGVWDMDGALPLDDFEEIVRCDKLPEDEDVKFYTLAGFVLSRLERIPVVGDSFEWADLRFEVTAMHHNRISRVRVSRLSGK